MRLEDDYIITTEDLQSPEDVLGGIGAVFFKYMKKHSQRVAQIDVSNGEIDTFANVLTKCIRTGISFKKMGIKKGDIVTYYSRIHINSVVPVVACYLIGAIPTYLDTLLPSSEVAHLLKIATPKLLLTDKAYLQQLQSVAQTAEIETNIIIFDEKFFEYQEGENDFTPIFIDNLEELAAIHFSSGSTGLPKGICLNHYRFLAWGGSEHESYWRRGQDSVILGYDSFYWTTEMARLLVSIKLGACRLVDPEKLDPKKIWYILDKYKVNTADLIPFEIIRMCNFGVPNDVDLSSLLTIYVEGQLLPKQYEEKLRNMLPNVDVFQCYGLTEIGLLLCYTKSEEHKAYSRWKLESVGVPVEGSGISYKIVDMNTGKNLGPNQEGELRIKAKGIMIGYYNMDSSDQFDEDGWFKTGDLAYYDEDFCFFITGRIKELILWQGWHVSPAALETDLLSHNAVEKAVVIGVPHEGDGERPLGVVVLKDNADASEGDIEKHMRIKVPHQPMKVVIMKDLPMTTTGKVKRAELTKQVLNGKV